MRVVDVKVQVQVQAVRVEAHGVHSYELRALGGSDLPAFTAGAHVDLHLPNGMTRSYSLCNSPSERDRYVIAVSKSATSRGGSKFIHEQLHAGAMLGIGRPRNNFALCEDAAHSILIAGGIGITPMRAMIARLETLEQSWELFYSCRERPMAAYLGELQALGARKDKRVQLNFDREPGGAMLDLTRIARDAAADSHIYCCGPQPMLAAFESATAFLDPERVHLEYFASKPKSPATNGGFHVELARSGRIIWVDAGKSILDTLLAQDIEVPYSCMEGVCGACETRVLGGIPDHRDGVLSEVERASSDRMMICCSGAKTERIRLDL